jgi:hypothetical protein
MSTYATDAMLATHSETVRERSALAVEMAKLDVQDSVRRALDGRIHKALDVQDGSYTFDLQKLSWVLAQEQL